MKYFALIFLLIALNCSKSKKDIEIKKDTSKEKIETVKEEKKVVKEEIIKEQELILVLQNPKKLEKVKEYITENQLAWNDLAINKNTLKVATIKVPLIEKNTWIEKLNKTNLFSSVEIFSDNVINEIKETAENTFIRIRKTKCSGDCAVYNLTLFKNGLLIFKGLNNVPSLGLKQIQLPEEKLKKLKERFSKTNFGTYFDAKINESNKDFSSTFIMHGDKEIEIKLWKNAPEELAIAYDYLDSILLENKLIY